MSRPRRPHVHRSDVLRLGVAWVISTVALIITAALLPNLSADSPWAWAAVAAVAGVLGFVVRPVLIEVSARLNWIVVLLVAVVGQALIMYLAMQLVGGIHASFWTALVASWVAAAVSTVIAFVTTAGTEDGLVVSLSHRGRRAEAVADPEVDGVVFVQLDGVPFPVLRWAVQSGGVPTIRKWLTTGDYKLREWTPQIPCTTPASQLGLLHGTVDGVPAFRWYDRELGRVLVANRPADARVIEDRASTGSGLLYDDGVSIGNLFSGDAPRSMLTMSRLGSNRGSVQVRRAFAWFLTSPNGLTRSLSRTFAEVVKERWQARRQEHRDLQPRMRRTWEFAGLRAVTNGLLGDLNTALVAEEMRRGTRSIYVNYVDYDEIAHHAGMFRPESLQALDGLDRVLASLVKLAESAPRRYRVVALSDHGQSQGSSFQDRYGVDLGSLCESLIAQRVQTMDAAVEGLGRAGSLVGDVGEGGLTGTVAHQLDRSIDHAGQVEPEDKQPVVVLGSGNLGLMYVRDSARLTLDDLERRWPALVAGLVAHPGVGFVAALDDAGVPWAIGARGRIDLSSGSVEGLDPLSGFGHHAARLLCRAVLMPEAPDLYVNSLVDEVTADVAAFEDLVGAHGGLGGWQDRAVLLAPSDLLEGSPAHIEGADRLHEVLVAMLETAGHRRTPAPAPAAEAV